MLKNPDYFRSDFSTPGKDVTYPVIDGSWSSGDGLGPQGGGTAPHSESRDDSFGDAGSHWIWWWLGDKAGHMCVNSVLFGCVKVEAQEVDGLAAQTGGLQFKSQHASKKTGVVSGVPNPSAVRAETEGPLGLAS